MSFLRDTSVVFVYRIALVGVAFLTDVLLARYLGPTGKGIVAILVVTPTLLGVLGGAGLDYSLNYFGHRDRAKLGRVFTTTLIWGAGSACVLILVLLPDPFGLRSWLYSGIGVAHSAAEKASLAIIPSEVFFALAGMLAMTAGRPILFGKMRLIRRSIVLLVVAVVAATVSSDSTTAILLIVLGQVVGIVTAGLVGPWQVRYRFAPPDRRWMSIQKYGLGSLPARLAERLQTRVDVVLLGILASGRAVGVYTVATAVAEMLFFLSGSLGTVLFSRDARRDEELHRRVLRTMYPVGSVLALVAGGAGFFLVPIFYGTDFSQAVPWLWALLPGVVSFSYVHVASPYLVQHGLSGSVSLAHSVGVGTNVGLNVFLIPLLGGLGAAIASSVSYSLTAIVILRRMRIHLDGPVSDYLVPSKVDVSALATEVRRNWNRVGDADSMP